MMRRASSAAESATATRISPSALTVIGQIACVLPDARKPSMPWLSSSAMTTLASISDEVANTTTTLPLSDLQQHHRHVVLLCRGSGEGLNLAEDTVAQLVGRQIGVLARQVSEPRVAKAVAGDVHRFADPVGIEQEQIAETKRQGHFLERPAEQIAGIELQTEHHPVRLQRL